MAQEKHPECRKSAGDISIRTELRAGDAGYITFMHGRIYQKEYGYSTLFEAYVAKSFFDFLQNYDPSRDRLWCAEDGGTIIGCIGIAGHGDRAQLRWFLIEPEYRGLGLDKKLLSLAVDFARNRGYQTIYLDTTSDLTQAVGLYRKMGFEKVKETPNNSWKKGVTELEFSMDLS